MLFPRLFAFFFSALAYSSLLWEWPFFTAFLRYLRLLSRNNHQPRCLQTARIYYSQLGRSRSRHQQIWRLVNTQFLFLRQCLLNTSSQGKQNVSFRQGLCSKTTNGTNEGEVSRLHHLTRPWPLIVSQQGPVSPGEYSEDGAHLIHPFFSSLNFHSL